MSSKLEIPLSASSPYLRQKCSVLMALDEICVLNLTDSQSGGQSQPERTVLFARTPCIYKLHNANNKPLYYVL